MLLTDEELAPLMQRKAQIQATLRQNAGADSACATTSGTCPSCQCGSGSGSATATSAPPRRALTLVLGTLALLALLALGGWAVRAGWIVLGG